ncbi:hypothetical protein [Roseibium litorale]|uniref:Uncharacterized protein n=1 Tax=Roseibium litorale TaxID=2803841 RepID=A0ABR9CM23_9HYPH|nr:hypothetical protein [Roseibium litorale]MBD8891900.1 hypothetical protein [Roseibium litorale]
MNVGSVGSGATAQQISRFSSNEMKEGPGPDKINDHDADDLGAASAPAPKGTGTLVDITV